MRRHALREKPRAPSETAQIAPPLKEGGREGGGRHLVRRRAEGGSGTCRNLHRKEQACESWLCVAA